jgi:hypothetical protein
MMKTTLIALLLGKLPHVQLFVDLAQNVHRTFAMVDIPIGMHLALAIINILVGMHLTHHVHVKTLAMVSALVKHT